MIIAFFGHSDLIYSKDIEDKLLDILQNKVNDKDIFYLGGYGNFDYLAKRCCLKLKKSNSDIKLYFITPYID